MLRRGLAGTFCFCFFVVVASYSYLRWCYYYICYFGRSFRRLDETFFITKISDEMFSEHLTCLKGGNSRNRRRCMSRSGMLLATLSVSVALRSTKSHFTNIKILHFLSSLGTWLRELWPPTSSAITVTLPASHLPQMDPFALPVVRTVLSFFGTWLQRSCCTLWTLAMRLTLWPSLQTDSGFALLPLLLSRSSTFKRELWRMSWSLRLLRASLLFVSPWLGLRTARTCSLVTLITWSESGRSWPLHECIQCLCWLFFWGVCLI